MQALVEGQELKNPGFFEALHETGINGGDQLGISGEPATNQLRARRCDEVSHFWMAACVVRALDEDEARLAKLSGLVEFALSRRDALRIFPAVFVAQ